MRKEIKQVVLRDFYEALKILGYVKCRENGSEWRHHQFHLTVRKKPKKGITLQIHEDTPIPLPPFHKARHESKALEQEFQKILDAYRKWRTKNDR